MGRDGYPWYRKSKRCWYVWHGGQQVRLHGDKTEAFRIWHEMISSPAGKLTVGQLVTGYLEAMTSQWKPSTLHTKRKILLPLAEAKGDMLAALLDAQRWLDTHPGWGRSKRWLVALTIKAAWRWAVDKELLNEDPFASWSVPTPCSRGADAVIEHEDHEQVLEAAPDCYRLALSFLHATGCRPGEMCEIEAKDVHLDAGVVILAEHKTDGTAKPRLILLAPVAVEVVKVLIDRYPEGKLFRHTKGKPLTPDRLRNWVFKTCRRLGLKIIPYGYRHTFATDALVKGTPDAIVAQLLGHSGTTMLHRHYSHLTARLQALKAAAEQVRPKEE